MARITIDADKVNTEFDYYTDGEWYGISITYESEVIKNW